MEMEDIRVNRKTKIEKEKQPRRIFKKSFSGFLKRSAVGFDEHTDYSMLNFDSRSLRGHASHEQRRKPTIGFVPLLRRSPLYGA
jgi:hypothetical protein